MLLVGRCLNSEQIRRNYIEKMHFGTKTSGLNREGGLNYEWS